MIFWREVESPDGKDIKSGISVEEAAKLLAEKLRETPMTSTDARMYARKEFGGGIGDKAYKKVDTKPEAYEIEISSTGVRNGKMFGPLKRSHNC